MKHSNPAKRSHASPEKKVSRNPSNQTGRQARVGVCQDVKLAHTPMAESHDASGQLPLIARVAGTDGGIEGEHVRKELAVRHLK